MAVAVALLLIATVAMLTGRWLLDLRRDHRPFQPVGRVAGLYGRALILYLAAAAWSLFDGYGGGDSRDAVCVPTAYSVTGTAGGSYTARAGAAVSAAGSVRACALHPGLAQWALYLLTRVPGLLVWGAVLLLLWRLIRQAGADGPFTAAVAVRMQQLGWVVAGGSMAAGALAALGRDVLAPMLMTPAPFSGAAITADVIEHALQSLLPVPGIAGAALLSFARIIRAGQVLDEEVRATV